MQMETVYLPDSIMHLLRIKVLMNICSICFFQCVVNSQRLPWSTISVVRDHPEMTGWVHSIHQTAPFYISNHNYTKIVVDRVQAADQREYNIMLLTTGKSL